MFSALGAAFVVFFKNMDDKFEDKRQQSENIRKYQQEIENLLKERPDLVAFQKNLEAQLDRVGTLDTPEGRANRAAFAFSLLREALLEFREGIEEYQNGLCDAFEGKRKPHLRLLK